MSTGAAFTFATRTDVGRQREQNEDNCGEYAAAGGELLVVCDGMGGHEAGEVASKIAVDTIAQIFQNSTEEDPGERLRRGFLVANQRILKHADDNGLDKMGTTAVATFVRDGDAWIAHVGDSRVYHLRGGAVLWRTSDHTRVQKMVERGILTPEEAKTHEDANIVTRALGFAKGEEAPVPDVAPRPLREGDTLLLCSDGLHDLVTDEELAELASYAPPDEATATLVELANRRGGHDNITVAVLRWGKAELARPAGTRRTALEFAVDVPAPMKTEDGTRRAPARTNAAGAGAGAATAIATSTSADDRPKRAAVLVIAGVALVGLAAAVYLMTRGGGSGTSGGGGAAGGVDGGGAAVRFPDATGGDAGDAGSTPAADGGGRDAGGGGSGSALPSWTSPPTRPTGSASGPRGVDAGVAAPRSFDGGVIAPRAIDAGVPGPRSFDAGVPRPHAVDAGVAGPRAADAGVARPRAIDAGPSAPRAPDAGTTRTTTKPDAGAKAGSHK